MGTSTSNTALTDADQSKVQKITNNSGVDIVVCMPLTSAETEHSSPIVSYNKDYVILRTPNGTVIKNGETDTVTLNRTYIKDGKVEYSLGYDLLISGSTWLTPIANIGVVQDSDMDSDPEVDFFNPVTVTADSQKALQQASDFYQAIAAYPDSKLAKDYVDAMNKVNTSSRAKANGSSGSAGAVQTAVDGGVAGFFKNTKNYQQVTLADIVFVEGFYNRFPFVWAQYADLVTYYLYSSDGKTTSFQGKLTLSKSGDIDITKANGGYTCQFLPAVTPTDTSKTDVDSSKAKTLTYSDGIFADDMTSDIPGIAVKGSFQLKRTFTKDPNDTKIMTIMSGSINGQIAVGFDEAQLTKPDDPTQDWLNSLFHPKTAAGIFNSIMTIGGALLMLHFACSGLYNIGKWIKEALSAKEPVTGDGMDTEFAKLREEYVGRSKAKLTKLYGDKATLPETPEDAVNVASAEKGTLSDLVSKGNAEVAVTKMRASLKDLEEFVPDDTTGTMQQGINEATTDLRGVNAKLSNADIADLKATLAEIKPMLQNLTTKVTNMTNDFSDLISQQQKDNMKENTENVQKQAENEEKTTENETEESGSESPGDGAQTVEFPEGEFVV